MTDAALPMTERAVERFVESHLSALGADIRKDGRRWTVTLPEGADTELSLDEATMVVTNDPGEVAGDEIAIAPESPFVERLLDEAAEQHPVGSLELTGETVDVRLPPWLTESPVEVTDDSFTPYYDRNGLCVLFHVGIETVSEYQSEELRAVAIDLNGNERLPELAETYLQLAEDGNNTISAGGRLGTSAEEALADAREAVQRDVTPLVEDVRKRATRAATVELEEYREYARQRLDELDGELDRLSERITETTETAEEASEQSARVEALRERKELRNERDDLREERDDLRAEIEAGFPERRDEVRDRHSITVRMQPVALAVVTFERGEIALSMTDGESSADGSYPYAVGVGITDEQNCERCSETLTDSNPLTIVDGRLLGANCCR